MNIRTKKLRRRMICLTAGLTALFAAVPACACTAVYVGSKISSDGTVIISRSNDMQGVLATYITVTERVENEPGRTMPVSDSGEVRTEIPADTYHYTSTPVMQNTMNQQQMEKDAAVCTNEYGVAMTMSVTAFSNERALAADPLVKDGLTENAANDLVICQSRTAREGVETLLRLVDQYGSDGGNIAIIADQKEAWYIEIYTGHQYAAVRLPDDKAAVFGNEFTMEYLSDFEESMTSEELFTLPEENGFAQYGENGELNLYDTYSGDEMRTIYSHMRTWIGHQKLAPSAYGDYDAEAFYPLLFDPDEKVSLAEVISLMRNRYEGTPYSPDETGRIDMRVIGTDAAMSVHVLQIYPDLPAALGVVTWESLSPDIYGVFIPLSNLCTSVSEAYGAEQPLEEEDIFDTEHYAWFTLKAVNTLALLAPDVYGQPVREYWEEAEKGMQENMPRILEQAAGVFEKDPEAAASYVTDYCNSMQTQAFEDAKKILNTQTWYLNKNSNTFRIAVNPEDGQPLDTERVLDPIPIDLDAAPYHEMPEQS